MPAAIPAAAAESAVPNTGWSCLGEPPDIAAGWHTEVAAVASTTPDALEKAMQAAQAKLRAKVCTSGDRAVQDACAFLAAKIEPWTTGRSAHEVCASAVIKSQHIETWKSVATNLEGFDARLARSARLFIDTARNANQGGPRIALAAVYDDDDAPGRNQLPGGRRADWLASRFGSFFATEGGLRTTPKAWIPGEVPDGYDLIITGRMYRKPAIDVAEVEVTWTGVTPDGRRFESPSGAFPETAAPSPPAAAPPPIATTEGLYLTMDSDHAGSICPGERTQVWLKSDEALHVRVFDLYGDNEAMLIFPPDAETSDLVPSKRTIPLGDEKGFEAVRTPGSDAERYLVIAAPTLAGLGRFAATQHYCRLPRDLAQQLHRGEGLPPGARVAATGYRMTSGASCPPAPSPEYERAALSAIARLPSCFP
ncbi:MAG TPA: hypothetical protein VJU61_24755 [Polyangiaceae bacterium]|nr:hypothetical protein [Polyangiaceae bacterium]